jgi:hypothetical protein
LLRLLHQLKICLAQLLLKLQVSINSKITSITFLVPAISSTVAPTIAPVQDKMTFRELDTMLNKLIDDFEQQQHAFKRQVDDVNAYDLVLADNEEKVKIQLFSNLMLFSLSNLIAN